MTTSRFSQESLEQFGECWEGLEDPRSGNAGLHDFHELLAIALCCVLCGGQGPTDMALFARAKEPFLRGFLTLANGLPSHDTFNRLFRDLDPDQFRDSFQRFMAQFSEQLQGVVAIDGKVLRRSFDRASGKSPLHMVSAWGCRQRLVLAQIATDAKSNEITAVPKLLKLLTLQGAIVTADALNCQRAIAEQIVEQQGDYALALKANQGTLHEDVVLLLDDPELKASRTAPLVEADHGRIETRTATVSTDIGWLQKHHRNRILPAQFETDTRAIQRGCASTLEHRKQPPLAVGRGNERGSGPHPSRKRSPQSRRAAAHGHQCHAKRRFQRFTPRKTQTRRMERGLPQPAIGDVLKCVCPGHPPNSDCPPRCQRIN